MLVDDRRPDGRLDLTAERSGLAVGADGDVGIGHVVVKHAHRALGEVIAFIGRERDRQRIGIVRERVGRAEALAAGIRPHDGGDAGAGAAGAESDLSRCAHDDRLGIRGRHDARDLDVLSENADAHNRAEQAHREQDGQYSGKAAVHEIAPHFIRTGYGFPFIRIIQRLVFSVNAFFAPLSAFSLFFACVFPCRGCTPRPEKDCFSAPICYTVLNCLSLFFKERSERIFHEIRRRTM